MSDSFLKVLAVTVAGSLQLTVVWGRFSAWSTIVGLILTLILLTIPLRTAMSWAERGAFSMVWGMSLLLAAGRPLSPLLLPLLGPEESPNRYYFAFWALVTVVVFVVTRQAAARARP
jgi:hypothetical protein